MPKTPPAANSGTIQVPLSKLSISPANVRKHDPEAMIDQLADNIAERGLMQNLVAAPIKKKPGCYEVLAGGRRYRAMMRLVEADRWPADHLVDIKTFVGTEAAKTEASLTENFIRLGMTATDEIRAFRHFISEGDDLDAVARRFGMTRRHIEQRLRLADLAPPIFAALEEGAITLEIAKAFATTPNHDRQLAVWEESADQPHYLSASTVKRRMETNSVLSTSAIALLVGATAYTEAGGRIESDLFAENGDKWIDAEIAIGLATAHMDSEAERLRVETGLSFIRPLLSHYASYSETEDLHRLPVPPRPMTDDEQTEYEALIEKIGAIDIQLEDDEDLDEEAAEALYEERDDLADKMQTLSNQPGELTDEQKAEAGTFLLLANDGQMQLDTTIYTTRKPKVTPISTKPVNSGATGEPVTTDGAPVIEKPLSAKLALELAVQRRDVLALNLASAPLIALDYALFTLIDPALTAPHGNAITTSRYDAVTVSPYPQSPAHTRYRDIKDNLDWSWAEHDSIVDRFRAFQALDEEAKVHLFAFVVAGTLNAHPGVDTPSGYGTQRPNPLQDEIARQLAIDTAEWWRPTAENFFDRVPKPTILTLLKRIGGDELSARYVGNKKTELAEAAEKIFAGTAILDPEVRTKALAWAPPIMRFAPEEEIDVESPADEPDSGDSAADELAEAIAPESETACVDERGEGVADNAADADPALEILEPAE